MPIVEIIPFEYRCIVTDSAGNTVTSNIARVEMPPSPDPIRITQQPKSVRGKAGDYTKLTIKVEGGKKPYYYFWYEKKMVDREFKLIYDYDFKYDNPELKVKITDDIWEYYCDVCDYDHYHIESNRVTVHNNDYVKITI